MLLIPLNTLLLEASDDNAGKVIGGILVLVALAVYQVIKEQIPKVKVSKAYQVLIQNLLGNHPNTRIFESNKQSAKFGISTVAGGDTIFFLRDDSITEMKLTWFVRSPCFGHHKKEWIFKKDIDQKVLADDINYDIHTYSTKFFTT